MKKRNISISALSLTCLFLLTAVSCSRHDDTGFGPDMQTEAAPTPQETLGLTLSEFSTRASKIDMNPLRQAIRDISLANDSTFSDPSFKVMLTDLLTRLIQVFPESCNKDSACRDFDFAAPDSSWLLNMISDKAWEKGSNREIGFFHNDHIVLAGYALFTTDAGDKYDIEFLVDDTCRKSTFNRDIVSDRRIGIAKNDTSLIDITLLTTIRQAVLGPVPAGRCLAEIECDIKYQGNNISLYFEPDGNNACNLTVSIFDATDSPLISLDAHIEGARILFSNERISSDINIELLEGMIGFECHTSDFLKALRIGLEAYSYSQDGTTLETCNRLSKEWNGCFSANLLISGLDYGNAYLGYTPLDQDSALYVPAIMTSLSVLGYEEMTLSELMEMLL